MVLAAICPPSTPSPKPQFRPSTTRRCPPLLPFISVAPTSRACDPIMASRRLSNYNPKEAVVVIRRSLSEERDYETEEEEEEEEEEEDRSLDLLARFLQNMFCRVSRRARRAAQSVLPVSIPRRLVAFSVNGVLILAFLWILKALLEVVCTLGTMVFVSILLVRVIWFGVSNMQESRFSERERFDDDREWRGVQAAT